MMPMTNREEIAKWVFAFGVLAFAGTVVTGSVASRPATTAVTLAMIVPYLAIQFRSGMASADA